MCQCSDPSPAVPLRELVQESKGSLSCGSIRVGSFQPHTLSHECYSRLGMGRAHLLDHPFSHILALPCNPKLSGSGALVSPFEKRDSCHLSRGQCTPPSVVTGGIGSLRRRAVAGTEWAPSDQHHLLHDPTYCSPQGSSVHGICQARILEWAAISSSRGIS